VSSQDKQSSKGDAWKVTVYENSVLKSQTQNDRLQVEIAEGQSRVLVFERTVGNIAVDAGYMERIWLEVNKKKENLRIPYEGSGFYEQICRCENNGLHHIIDGSLKWVLKGDSTLLSGYISLNSKRLEW
jgi:hypothetical protein